MYINLYFLLCRIAFAKVWYNVYNNKRERVASLMLRKSHLRSKIQHRIPEFDILDVDQKTKIGRISPFSTNLQGTGYRTAVAIKSLSSIHRFKHLHLDLF